MRSTPLLLAIAVFAASCSGGGGVQVTDARTPAPPTTNVAAAYLTIANSGGEPDSLLGASTALAATVEMHESSTTDGMVQMRPVPVIDIPPGGSVTLEPGGLHLMLMGLAGELKEGDEYTLTLEFEVAGTIQVQVQVVSPTEVVGG